VYLKQRTDQERNQCDQESHARDPLLPTVSVTIVSMAVIVGQAVEHRDEEAGEKPVENDAQNAETRNYDEGDADKPENMAAEYRAKIQRRQTCCERADKSAKESEDAV
jgi:hypothetical protein